MMRVYEVNTVERVQRRYLVQVDTARFKPSATEDDFKLHAEEKVCSGEQHKFTEGNAEIEEVLSVEHIDNSDAQ